MVVQNEGELRLNYIYRSRHASPPLVCSANSTSVVLLNTSSTDAAGASVTIDLGAHYDLRSVVIFFDRYNVPTAATTMRVLNSEMASLGFFAVAYGGCCNHVVFINSINTGLSAPTPTSSPSATRSESVPPSATGSPSLSAGITASRTATVSGSPSNTPSASVTPLSPYPNNIRVDLNAAGLTAQCLNLMELIAFDRDFRIVSSTAAGGVARMSSIGTYAGTNAGLANDMLVSHDTGDNAGCSRAGSHKAMLVLSHHQAARLHTR